MSSLTCEENDHTHTEACYTKVCDHKDGHLSTCYSTSEYAFCTHENDSEHSGTISIAEVVTFNGTKPTEVGTYDITAIAFGENYNVVVDSGVLTITHDWSDFQHDDTNHWKECSYCGTKSEEGTHTGGQASCKELAVCEKCGASYGEYTDHTYGDWEVIKEATTTELGKKQRECSVCGHIEEATIPLKTDTTQPDTPDTPDTPNTPDTPAVSGGQSNSGTNADNSSNIPDTGDHSNAMLWISILLLAFATMVVTFFFKRNRSHKAR